MFMRYAYAENMFYGASPAIFEKAKILRRNMTVAEKLLWERLSKRQLGDFRFTPGFIITLKSLFQ